MAKRNYILAHSNLSVLSEFLVLIAIKSQPPWTRRIHQEHNGKLNLDVFCTKVLCDSLIFL
jgi:hypothetical protein